MDNVINILGGSQTFLGVLATIIVLFILEDKSNIISFLLQEIKARIKRQINSLNITTSLDGIVNKSSSFKLLNRYIKDKNPNQELNDEVSKLLMDIEIEKASFKAKYISVESNNPNLEHISKAKEIYLAPLYTLLFSLFIFIFDELLRADLIKCDSTIFSVMTCFIVLSYIFWFFIWWMYYKNNQNYKIKTENKNKFISHFLNFRKYVSIKFWDTPRPKKITIILISFIFILIFIELLFWFCEFHNILSISLFFIAPFVLLAIFMGMIRQTDKPYSYAFMIGHFFLIFLVSLLEYFIHFGSSVYFYGQIETTPVFDITLVKILIFSFVLLNGIFLPFLLPYIIYFKYYNFSKQQVLLSQTEAEKITEELKQKLDEVAEKIPE